MLWLVSEGCGGEDTSVIVVVLLLTKPTLSGLSVRTRSHPDGLLLDTYNDQGAPILIVSAAGTDATSRPAAFWPGTVMSV